MAQQYHGVRIYATFKARDLSAYLESLEDDRDVDVEATLNACEKGIEQALATVHPEAHIVLRRQDEQASNPPRTRVETDDASLDPELIGQEIDDLIAEFDITECVVYRDEPQPEASR
jgi:hypothetical protein